MPEIRPAHDRFHTVGDGVDTWHSFSYGAHYEPTNVGFGPVIAINTERVEPGRGYEPHHHADVEIVTWVLRGVLQHEDTTGHRGMIRPGTAQRLSAGTGVQHSERNGSARDELVFVQMMLASDHDGEPEYAHLDLDLRPGVLTPTVSVHAPAELAVVRLGDGDSVRVPAASRSLLHVTSGAVELGGTTLAEGDEARFTAEDAYDLSATGAGGEALIWQLPR